MRHVPAAILVAVLAIAGCGGDDDTEPVDEPVDEPAEEPAGEPADEPAPSADGASITIAGFAFDGPSEVAVGTTVVVTNDDGSTHTWTAADGTFDSGPIAAGESFEFTFDEPGEFSYFCNIHPSMTGTITVTG